MQLLRHSILTGLAALKIGALSCLADPHLLVTELLSNEDSSGTEDYWELTNVGDTPADLSNWSWDDDSETPGTVVIPAGVSIAPGESIIFTEMEAAAFRTWWDLSDAVQVITGVGAPGLGGGDGVYLYNASNELVASFSYAADGFTRSDGTPSTDAHAGPSAGGSVDWQAAVIDPHFGVETPRYTVADGSTLGTFGSTLSATEFGSPGFSGIFVGHLLVTELLSNEDSDGTEDYWELTNAGRETVDLGGWSWDDNSAEAGTIMIPAGTMIAPGESIIFTEMEAAAFRVWWALNDSVQVITGIDAPGLGGGDGVYLFDGIGVEIAAFNYDAGGFTRSDGTPSTDAHAGPSAGGSVDWQAVVIDPTFGTEMPRYTAADGTTFGTFASTLSTAEFGSPGFTGLFPPRLLITELLSNEDSDGTEDYWELTSLENEAIDLSGWSWDDDSAEAGTVMIPAGTLIAPGESIIFTEMEAAAFRAWWGIADSVQVITGADAPGLGGGDGIYLFDANNLLVAEFSYDADGFTRIDGSPAAGGHAGPSAGGAVDWQAVVVDPAFGTEMPRYTVADGSTLGTFASTLSATEFGSPGFSGLFAAHLIVTELLSNEDSDGTEDYWELTNAGNLTADLSGWSWDDNSEEPGTVVIPTGVSIAPGESIIFTEMEATAFRTWWGLADSVQVITGVAAPGLGGGDGVFLYNVENELVASFNYAAGGFTKSDGSPSNGGHAGPSAGGSVDWEAAVLDPAYGVDTPRYTFADGNTLGTFASTLSAAEFGSPGFVGLSNDGGDEISLSLEIAPAIFSESASNPAATGTISRSGGIGAELVVNLASSDTGELTVPETVTIPAGQASATFEITAVDDSFPDGDQTVTVTASAAGTTPAVSDDITVQDDGDVLTTNFLLTELQSNQSDLAPSGAEDYWELTNFGESAEDISGYSWHDSGRSASSAAAWALPEGTIIGAGESVIFTEADPATFRAWWGLPESVQVFQSPGAPGLGKNDGVSFFDEGGNELFFFSYAAGGFTREDGSDSLGEHAGPSGGGANDWDALIWVPSSGTEAPRYTAATGSNFASFQAASPATDFGSPGNQGVVVPTVAIGNASVTEGDSGTVLLTFEVTRSHTDTAFTVEYAVTGGDATAGVDYVALPASTLTFVENGDATQMLSITVNGDTDSEEDETIALTLSNLLNTVGDTFITTTEGIGTILNDDPVLPSFTSHPDNTTIASGSVTTLVIEASGFPEPSVQWYEGESGDTTNPIDGATESSFTTPTLTETTDYWVRLSNSAGDTDSETITVTVTEAATVVDLSIYVRVGRYDLPEPKRTALPSGTPSHNLLCQEVSAVTYNWDTDTLFTVGDGGRSVTQVSKTGELIDTMTLALGDSPQGTDFYDPEGITYIGNGEFVFSEERDRQLVKFTYVADTTLTRGDTQTVKIGTFVDNTGTEGLSYDPLTGGFILLKEISPIGVFQSDVDFDAGTASNGSPTTENSTNLFDPALLGMSDVADVFALSNLPSFTDTAQEGNLLILGQEDARIVNIDRAGNIHSTLQIVSDVGNPLSVGNQQHEGLTMDRAGNLYVVSENGGGGIDFPQLWVYAPSAEPNAAPTGLVLNNAVDELPENTGTASPLKLGEVVVEDDGLGTNVLSLSGADAAFFEIVGTEFYLVSGTVLDFETKASYSVTIEVDDTTVGNSPDATVAFTLTLTDVEPEIAPPAAVIISEVAPWSSGNSPVGADWFELTNTSDNPINLTGWKVDDGSATFTSAADLTGITTIDPGESVIFIESSDLSAIAATFSAHWFGDNPPAGLQIGSYSGSGLGLSTGGDGVTVFNASGSVQASVTFGASPSGAPFGTFDNTVGINEGEGIPLFSTVNVNGAFTAADSADEIGSPGYAAPGILAITEVAPWSSGNSPVGADWFEVTNLGSRTVDISGWKMDDGSESASTAVALTGVTTIAPGESVIFIEYNTTLEDAAAAFLSNWFGETAPEGLQIGGYTGSGVGLSTGGDAVNLYDSRIPTPTRRANVSFGSSPSGAPFGTFDNAAGLDLETLTLFSMLGVNGAFAAVHSPDEIGSPGSITSVPLATAFASWLARNNFVSEGFGADTDGNGVIDAVEYFFNQDPGNPGDLGNMPRIVYTGESIEMRFVVNSTSALPGYLQFSDDLELWEDAVLGRDYTVEEETTAGDETTIRYSILQVEGVDQRFFTIQISDGSTQP